MNISLVNVYAMCEKQQYLAVCISEKKDRIELYDLSHRSEKPESYSAPCKAALLCCVYKIMTFSISPHFAGVGEQWEEDDRDGVRLFPDIGLFLNNSNINNNSKGGWLATNNNILTIREDDYISNSILRDFYMRIWKHCIWPKWRRK